MKSPLIAVLLFVSAVSESFAEVVGLSGNYNIQLQPQNPPSLDTYLSGQIGADGFASAYKAFGTTAAQITASATLRNDSNDFELSLDGSVELSGAIIDSPEGTVTQILGFTAYQPFSITLHGTVSGASGRIVVSMASVQLYRNTVNGDVTALFYDFGTYAALNTAPTPDFSGTLPAGDYTIRADAFVAARPYLYDTTQVNTYHLDAEVTGMLFPSVPEPNSSLLAVFGLSILVFIRRNYFRKSHNEA